MRNAFSRLLSFKYFQRKHLALLFIMHIPVESPLALASIKDIHNMLEICIELHIVQKNYSLVGMGVRYDNPKEGLQKAINKIDSDFSSLTKDNHLGNQLESQIKFILVDWKKIRSIATTTPSQQKMLLLHNAIETLTDRCLKTVDSLEKDSQIAGEHYVVISAELGMEVQRLAALYMMRAWEIEQKNYLSEVKHILEEFERFYHDLHNADTIYVSDNAKRQLIDIGKDFLVFERMAESSTGRFVPSLAQRSANNLFANINELSKAIAEKVEK